MKALKKHSHGMTRRGLLAAGAAVPLVTICLVAERCWDRVRYAIEEYTWRFDGLRRRASHRRRT
ncbi:hypothetical protein FS317_20710 [Microvirga sp. M8]|nr:hypothetical protein [Microvirga tunisiensis]